MRTSTRISMAIEGGQQWDACCLAADSFTSASADDAAGTAQGSTHRSGPCCLQGVRYELTASITRISVDPVTGIVQQWRLHAVCFMDVEKNYQQCHMPLIRKWLSRHFA